MLLIELLVLVVKWSILYIYGTLEKYATCVWAKLYIFSFIL